MDMELIRHVLDFFIPSNELCGHGPVQYTYDVCFKKVSLGHVCNI